MNNLIIYICVFFILANCSNKTTYSGKILNQEELQDINFVNKTKLISKLGYPSYIDPIENKFFYFSEKKQKKSVFNNKIDYSFMFVFSFDNNDIIQTTKVYDLKNTKEFNFIDEETEIDVVKRGLLERIFGGIGPQTELPTTP